MYERELHQVLGSHPELIEPGLRFVEYETSIGEGLRCDILYEDSNGTKVYVEVKRTAGKTAVTQVEQYETVRGADDSSRFVLAALEAKPGIPDLLRKRGFEFRKIDRKPLLAIKPEWESKLQKMNRRKRQRKISPEMKRARLTVLHTMCQRMQDKLPGIYFNHSSKGSKDRLLLQWEGEDYFNFYFSNEIQDGFRFAFVVDLDYADSERRSAFSKILLGVAKEIAQTFQCPLGNDTGDELLMKEGIQTWVKISKHKWFSIYQMYRLPGTDWSDTEKAVGELIPIGYNFVEEINSLLQRYALPRR